MAHCPAIYFWDYFYEPGPAAERVKLKFSLYCLFTIFLLYQELLRKGTTVDIEADTCLCVGGRAGMLLAVG